MRTAKAQMKAAMLLLVLCIAVTSVEGRMEKHAVKRGVDRAHRELNKRQSAEAATTPVGAAVTTPVTSPTQPVAADDDPTTSQAGGNLLTNLFPSPSAEATPVSSSNTAVLGIPVSLPATQSSSSSATSIASTPSSRSVSSEATTEAAESESLDVINVTSTALIAASLSSVAAASASASTEVKDKEGGGINKTAMIVIIAVASSVALIAAIWTIFRKWKLSPSRQFEDKLTPINWAPDVANARRSEDKLALTRSNSGGSGVSSTHKGGSAVGPGMRRQNSWGSANGSANGYGARTDMQEIPYSSGMMPAYPPANQYAYSDHGYPDQGYQPYAPRQAPSPYENLQRQPTGFTNGGRYGEGYNRY